MSLEKVEGRRRGGFGGIRIKVGRFQRRRKEKRKLDNIDTCSMSPKIGITQVSCVCVQVVILFGLVSLHKPPPRTNGNRSLDPQVYNKHEIPRKYTLSTF